MELPPGLGPTRGVRTVRWSALPLGCVVIGWPDLYHAAVPELTEYPVLTERIRADLWRKYQFLAGTLVTVADPDPDFDFDPRSLPDRASQARRLAAVLPQLHDLKARSRRSVFEAPDAREGLASLGQYENSPYTLVRNGVKSLVSVVRGDPEFGATVWGPQGQDSFHDLLGRLMAGQVPAPGEVGSVVDVGLDVSLSMAVSGKAAFLLGELWSLVFPLARDLGVSTWRLWLVGEGATAVDWNLYRPGTAPDLDALLDLHRLRPGDTRFAPWLRQVLADPTPGPRHLALLLTDGLCQDRPETLRLLERLADRGVQYLQLVVHQDEEWRNYVEGDQGKPLKDNLVVESDLDPSVPVLKRSDADLGAICAQALGEVTDLAEAGRGSQLVLTWNPLFRLVTLDVYERFLESLGPNRGRS